MGGVLSIAGSPDAGEIRRGQLAAAGALVGLVYSVTALLDGLVYSQGSVPIALAAAAVPSLLAVYILARCGQVHTAAWLGMALGLVGYLILTIMQPESPRLGVGLALVAFAGFTLQWWMGLATSVVLAAGLVVGGGLGDPSVASIGSQALWIETLRQVLLMTLLVVAFIDGYDRLWLGIAESERKSQASLDQLTALHDELEETISLRTRALEQANAEMETFSYSVSHDLRAPMRHICGYLEIYLEDFGDGLSGQDRGHLQDALGEAMSLSKEVEGILAAYRPRRSVENKAAR